ncbi:MAG: macro domain-containing protein [Lachnospiraceae bacterium]|nr:macro domain-containing protein [Lachnospiraceae bacterium]
MPFTIIRNDITKMQVDALVNPACPLPELQGIVNQAIHQAAGSKLLKVRKKAGIMRTGDILLTKGYKLPVKYIIHMVGPVWQGGRQGEIQTLLDCYEKVLHLALKKHCKSIAFPLISTEAYGFPKTKALQVVVNAVSGFLMEHDMMIYLVILDTEAFRLSEQLFQDVKSYVEETQVVDLLNEEMETAVILSDDEPTEKDYFFGEKPIPLRSVSCERSADRSYASDDMSCSLSSSSLDKNGVSLPDLRERMGQVKESFSKMLLRLIDEKGMKDPIVYKRANLDRKLFSKIRKKESYQPSKATALALAIALELSLEETADLLSRAGYALSPSSQTDLIVEYFILNHNYNIFELNEVLFAFGQPILGEEKSRL